MHQKIKDPAFSLLRTELKDERVKLPYLKHTNLQDSHSNTPLQS